MLQLFGKNSLHCILMQLNYLKFIKLDMQQWYGPNKIFSQRYTISKYYSSFSWDSKIFSQIAINLGKILCNAS